MLEYGLNFYCMKDCEKVFTVCCVLHNILLSLGENFGFDVVAGCGRPYPGDGLWLEGSEEMVQRFIGETCTATIKANDKNEAVIWQCRSDLLAEHVNIVRLLEDLYVTQIYTLMHSDISN